MTDKCDNCGSQRIIEFGSHGKNLQNAFSNYFNIDHDGYLPDIKNICSGDDLYVDICMECGKVQGDFPKSDKEIKQAFDEEND